MNDHETRAEGGALYLSDGGDEWLEVGSFEDIFSVAGGETVAVEYDDHEATFGAPWLDTDEENVLTVDVRETLLDMSFPTTFYEQVAARSMTPGADGVPERTTFFTESMVRVWTSRGNLPDEDNPFID